jgi:hypothetical protein
VLLAAGEPRDVQATHQRRLLTTGKPSAQLETGAEAIARHAVIVERRAHARWAARVAAWSSGRARASDDIDALVVRSGAQRARGRPRPMAVDIDVILGWRPIPEARAVASTWGAFLV